MVMCFAVNCNHYSEQRICSFRRFPRTPLVREKWIAAVRRADKEVTNSSMLCSCHFKKTGDPNVLVIPTIFPAKNTVQPLFKKMRPSKRRLLEENKKNEAPPENSSLLGYQPSRSCLDLPSEAVTEAVDNAGKMSSIDENSRSSSRLQEAMDQLRVSSESRASSVELQAELTLLRYENDRLKQTTKKAARFSFAQIKDDENLVHLYTGLPNAYAFDCLFNLFEPITLEYVAGWTVGNKISKTDQLLITLMKLRLNLRHLDLACRFGCSAQTISNIFRTWIRALHEVLFDQLMKVIPSRGKNRACMPASFTTFTNCRIVLDCTEVKCTVPKSLAKQKLTYSAYKHQNTLKALVGVAPNGVVTFLSDLYPGSTSDRKIVEHCKILDRLTAGDLIRG